MKCMKISLALALAVVGTTAATATATAAGKSNPGVLNGVYRVTWTEKQLIAAGTSQRYAHGNHGVLTWTLRDGSFQLRWQVPPLCHGTYVVSGATVSIKQGPGCSGLFRASWSLRNGQLRLSVTRATDPGDRVLFGGKAWKKIG